MGRYLGLRFTVYGLRQTGYRIKPILTGRVTINSSFSAAGIHAE